MSTKSKTFGVLAFALGVTALALPATAQTGNPNAPTGTEIQNNTPPKGNVGASVDTTGAASGGMSGAAGARAPMGTRSVPPSNLGADRSGANPPSQSTAPGPKGHIGGN